MSRERSIVCSHVLRVSDSESASDWLLTTPSGPTRKETSLSEAQSYANIASANSHWELPVSASRILVEERALDSYQNILFSLTLFYSRFLTWPEHVTIISHAFKRPRLIDGHCGAIGLPLERVTFVGIDPESMKTGEKQGAIQGVKMAVGDWESDPHGRGDKLRGKRKGRNPYGVWQGVFEEGFEGQGTSRLVMKGEKDEETLQDDATRPWV